jgi:DMSO/TMAO reductase YedYZ molybdopterin-dependent catalytic subunit
MNKPISPSANIFRFILPALTLALAVACTPATPVTQVVQGTPTNTPTPTLTPTATPLTLNACDLPPIVVPTPAEMPGYAQIDPSTGLHVTGTAPEIDLETYRLEVTGLVDNPLSLSYDDLRCMPKVEAKVTIVCPSLFSDTTTFAGVPLSYVLELAGIQAGAANLQMFAGDGYSTTIALDVVLTGDNFIAYEWKGEPLPILHGFPVRMVFPDLTGARWVKWLVKLEVLP